jgi:D-serine deaminase-like pyridoxal phosphate-dependent protein
MIERPTDLIEAGLGPLAQRPAIAAALAELGAAGSRWRIPTPAATVDLDALERNIAKMAARAKAAGLALRPHAKSNKTPAIGKRQLAAGASGVCCAKLSEAEILTAAGVGPILLTSPIAGALNATRAARLALIAPGFTVVLDHPNGATELGVAARTAGAKLDVLIDIDVGLGRTGVADTEQALDVARAVAAQPALTLIGVQAYGGHWQHMTGANERAAAVADGMVLLNERIAALRAMGADIRLITGGGTGTFEADAAQGVLNEIQAGSYVFMDREYRDALGADPDGAFEQSLFIQAQVISANAKAWVTVDAGLKAFATDGPAPEPVGDKFGACRFRYFGDEHGLLMRPPGQAVERGERIDFVPPHCDPTVDRYDVLHFVRGDVLVDMVRVEARGASA